MSLTTYPISLPASPGIVTNTIRKLTVVARTTSPFSLAVQTQVWPGQMWLSDLVLPRMTRANGEAWASAFASLNGAEGSLLIGDTANKTPRGVATGTPVVNGASQSGYNLNTRGWSNSITGILKAGDWVQLGTGATARLYKNIFDVNSGGTGLATLTLWPSLRSSPADGEALTLAPARGKFCIVKEPEYSIGPDHVYTFSTIQLMEDLR